MFGAAPRPLSEHQAVARDKAWLQHLLTAPEAATAAELVRAADRLDAGALTSSEVPNGSPTSEDLRAMAAQRGDPKAALHAAVEHLRQNETKQAEALLQQVIDTSEEEADVEMARYYLKRYAVDAPNATEAWPHLLRAAELGRVDAELLVAHAHVGDEESSGRPGGSGNQSEALYRYRRIVNGSANSSGGSSGSLSEIQAFAAYNLGVLMLKNSSENQSAAAVAKAEEKVAQAAVAEAKAKELVNEVKGLQQKAEGESEKAQAALVVAESRVAETTAMATKADEEAKEASKAKAAAEHEARAAIEAEAKARADAAESAKKKAEAEAAAAKAAKAAAERLRAAEEAAKEKERAEREARDEAEKKAAAAKAAAAEAEAAAAEKERQARESAARVAADERKQAEEDAKTAADAKKKAEKQHNDAAAASTRAMMEVREAKQAAKRAENEAKAAADVKEKAAKDAAETQNIAVKADASLEQASKAREKAEEEANETAALPPPQPECLPDAQKAFEDVIRSRLPVVRMTIALSQRAARLGDTLGALLMSILLSDVGHPVGHADAAYLWDSWARRRPPHLGHFREADEAAKRGNDPCDLRGWWTTAAEALAAQNVSRVYVAGIEGGGFEMFNASLQHGASMLGGVNATEAVFPRAEQTKMKHLHSFLWHTTYDVMPNGAPVPVALQPPGAVPHMVEWHHQRGKLTADEACSAVRVEGMWINWTFHRLDAPKQRLSPPPGDASNSTCKGVQLGGICSDALHEALLGSPLVASKDFLHCWARPDWYFAALEANLAAGSAPSRTETTPNFNEAGGWSAMVALTKSSHCPCRGAFRCRQGNGACVAASEKGGDECPVGSQLCPEVDPSLEPAGKPMLAAEPEVCALAFHRRSALAGAVDAMHVLSHAYSNGLRGAPVDAAEAFFWSRKALAQGDARGRFDVAYSLEFGLGVEADPQRAHEMYGDILKDQEDAPLAAKASSLLALLSASGRYLAGRLLGGSWEAEYPAPWSVVAGEGSSQQPPDVSAGLGAEVERAAPTVEL
eukprot:TRINITY_DN36826_c0_g2_i1.p1 TRINITY_DN36826_c0_g2~~TRINITY_DN36826_c0_g2_i1.p1  ORF type:complete len:1030 (+),score=352.09 TRINITY_DN36826_c0_g2_i1:304-3393(+)